VKLKGKPQTDDKKDGIKRSAVEGIKISRHDIDKTEPSTNSPGTAPEYDEWTTASPVTLSK